MSLDATKLLETLLDLGSVGIGLAILIVIIFKLKDITLFHEYITSRRNKSIIENLNSGFISDKSEKYLKESLENRIFKSFEKVNWDKPFREKLLELRDDSKGNLSLGKIKRADIFIEHKDDRLVVKISCFEKFFLRLMLVVGVLLLLTGTSICVIFILTLDSNLNNSASISQFITMQLIIIFYILLLIYAAIFLMQNAQSLKYALEIDSILSEDDDYITGIEKCNLSSFKTKIHERLESFRTSIKGFFK